jgi:hypothetical protein
MPEAALLRPTGALFGGVVIETARRYRPARPLQRSRPIFRGGRVRILRSLGRGCDRRLGKRLFLASENFNWLGLLSMHADPKAKNVKLYRKSSPGFSLLFRSLPYSK